MRIVKILLACLLAAVTALYCGVFIVRNLRNHSDPPIISCASDPLDVSVSADEQVLLTGVTASDAQDGDLTDRILITGVSKLISDSTAKVTYVVFDSDDNMATMTRNIHYTDYHLPRFSLEEPLIYSGNEAISMMDRLHATDTIDGDITDYIRFSALTATSEAEIHTVSVQVTNSMGDTAWLTLPVIVHEENIRRPEIRLSTYLDYIPQGSVFNPRNYLLQVQTVSGRVSTSDVTITGNVDPSTPGTYFVQYTYSTGTSMLTVVVE